MSVEDVAQRHQQQDAPDVGRLDLRYEVLQLAAEPGLSLVVYTAEPGTASHDAVTLLSTLAASREDERAQSTAPGGSFTA